MAASRDGLHDTRVDSGDEVDGGVKVVSRHARFQRPLDSPVASGLATTAQRDRQADEHLFPFGQPSVRLGGSEVITKVRFSHFLSLVVRFSDHSMLALS